MPRDLQEHALVVGRETDALSKKLGRSPKVREVAKSLGCSVEHVLEAQTGGAQLRGHIARRADRTRRRRAGASLVEPLGGEDSGYELIDSGEIASTWRRSPRSSAWCGRCVARS